MATHVVVKGFGGPGDTRFTPGQVVDATAWPNVSALIASRYIRPRTVMEARDKQPSAPAAVVQAPAAARGKAAGKR
jgi:hypothetical protein